MADGEAKRIAAVTFADARAAERRIAGVAAAARVARRLAGEGYAEVRIVLPAGTTLRESARRDLRRLAGTAAVRIGRGDETDSAVAFESEALTESAAQVLRATGKAGDGPVSRRLNRPVSRRLSALLLLVPGIRPIHATVGTALLALAMFVALAAGGAAGLIAGALLYQAASIFDGVDGEIARATVRSSRAGAVLDSAVDVATNFGFIAGLTLNLALRGDTMAAALSAWGFVLFAAGLALIAWRAARAQGPFSLDLVKHQYRRRFPSAAAGALIRFLTIVSSRDFFALLFALLVVAGWPLAVLWLFAAAATTWILFVLGSIRLPLHAAMAPQG